MSGVRRDWGAGNIVFQAGSLANEALREEEGLEELKEGWCGWRIARQE